MIERLRERWGGSLLPSISIERDPLAVSRWDGEAMGPGYVVVAEGFGLTFLLFIGCTPAKEDRP